MKNEWKNDPLLSALRQPLLNWYEHSARVLPWREVPTPYRVWISEIMLQQTRVEAVKPYFERFINALTDCSSLAHAPEEQVLKLWEGLGYYSRARNLQKAAKIVTEQYGGKLPADYHALLALPGIGSYTAGAIASIAFGIPVPAVDGNVLRVIMRVLASRENIAKPQTKKLLEDALYTVMPKDRPGELNQALMELGATVCLPVGTAKCEECPLENLCRAKQRDMIAELPVKSAKRPRRTEDKTIFVILCNGKAALHKRKNRGLLAGLYELPSEEGTLNREQAVQSLKAMGFSFEDLEELPPAKHIFTHIEWHMTGWAINAEKMPHINGLVWADRRALAETYTLPTAFQAYVKELLKRI